jgi:nitrite reductase (NAD(P)H)
MLLGIEADLAEYFQHRNIEDLYLNDVGWYAKQNPEHFAFHIGEQVCILSQANEGVLIV